MGAARWRNWISCGAGWSKPEGDNLKLLTTLADSLDAGGGFDALARRLSPGGKEPGTMELASMNYFLSSINDKKALAALKRRLFIRAAVLTPPGRLEPRTQAAPAFERSDRGGVEGGIVGGAEFHLRQPRLVGRSASRPIGSAKDIGELPAHAAQSTVSELNAVAGLFIQK